MKSIKIIHASDIQVRTFSRHEEFVEHFENFYLSVKKQNPDRIIITGDIAHQKTTISSEVVDILAKFFRTLADIAPLHIIAGNHDCNLSNLSRMDVITPIVNALAHPNIHYYKHSGVYEVNDELDFVVFSCLDENWPTKNDVSKEKISFGLYHGMVKGAVLQNGMIVEDCQYTIEQFLDVVDYLACGDIHTMQYLDHHNSPPKAWMAGSLIQQNFGESTDKGYLLWTINGKDDHEVDFIELPNICPYYTIDMPDNLKLPSDLSLTENARIRLHSRQLTGTEKENLSEKIKNTYKPSEIVFKDDKNAHRQAVKITKDIKIEDLRNLETQNKLIKKFLSSEDISTNELEKIYEYNKQFQSAVDGEDHAVRNVQYKLKKMKWSNLFSYGEDNEFDFSKRKGLVSIVGNNGTGKSSIAVDIPLYTLFNTNSKGVVKNDLVINHKKDFCEASLEIDIDGNTYFLKRKTTTYLKGGKKSNKQEIQGKTDLDFYVVDKDGNKTDKNAEERSDTDKEVRNVFGTVDDFVATAMAPQWQLLSFIDKGSTERQKLLARYFDIDIFDKKHKLASEKFKELKYSLVAYDRNFPQEIEQCIKQQKLLTESTATQKKELSEYEQSEQELSNQIDKEQTQVLKSYVVNDTEESCVAHVRKYTELLQVAQQHFDEKKTEYKDLLLQLGIDKFDSADLAKFINGANKEKRQIGDVSSQIDILKEDLKKFSDYTCLNNDDCCMNREIVSREIKIKKLVDDLKLYVDAYEISKHRLAVMQELDEVKKKSEVLFKQIKTNEIGKSNYQEKLEFIQKNKEQIIKKQQSDARVQELREKQKEIQSYRRKFSMTLIQDVAKLSSNETTLENLKDQQKQANAIKQEMQVLEHYLNAVSKTGLPQQIVGNNLDLINSEIEKILGHTIGFSATLRSTGKDIDIFFKPQNGFEQRIELCSGMEKTIVAIVLRAALLNVTTLPKPNVYILDEVFSSLDAQYKDAIRQILEYLKTLFDAVIIITHVNEFADFVDHIVQIDFNDEGFARVL